MTQHLITWPTNALFVCGADALGRRHSHRDTDPTLTDCRTCKASPAWQAALDEHYRPGRVCFDDCEPVDAFLRPRTWNGWAMPCLPASLTPAYLKRTGFYDFEVKPDGIHYVSGNGDPETAPVITIRGVTCYDFSTQGLCWNTAPQDTDNDPDVQAAPPA
jgi:hypothetical protein